MSRIAALALVAVAACSAGGSNEAPVPFVGPEDDTVVSLRNATAVPIVYVAAGEGTLALLDIRPTLAPGEYGDRLVQPGETVAVTDIIGYQADLGVNFFLYRVEPGTGEARYATSLLATAAELARQGGVVTVTPSRL
jgi:hypothetical protein